ncbi:MAG: Fic family protein [Chitinophagaceae bacterium]
MDIALLLKKDLTLEEVFYYAAYIHVAFVDVYPFGDGNGRIGRLFEKLFLAEKLGPQAWLVQSEKNYYMHHQSYYRNLRLLGLEYETLNYSNALPFLTMLPQSLTMNS